MKRFAAVISASVVLLGVLPGFSAPVRQTVEATVLPAESHDLMLDTRADVLRAPASLAQEAFRALEATAPGARVTWNARTGTAKMVWVDGGTLTAPVAAPAERIARAWLADHRGLFGLSATGLASLKMTRDATLPIGVHPLVFRLEYGAIPTFDGGTVGVNVTNDGRIVSAWADMGPTGVLNATPKITASDALRAVARFERAPLLSVKMIGQRASGDRLAIFDAGGLYQRHNVRLVAVSTATGPRLAWRVFFAKSPTEMLSTAVDAATAQVIFRHNQVAFEGETGSVFRNYPGAPKGGTQEEVSFDGDPSASPNGWVGIPTADGAPSVPTTLGNNVFAWTDWSYPKLAANNQAPTPVGIQNQPLPDYMPVAPNGKFDYPFTNEWSKACAPQRVGTPTGAPVAAGRTVENPSYIQDRDPSVTNVFYLANTIHDLSYKVGFTETMGNFQWSNFDHGGKAMDPIQIMSMAGVLNGQLDNAWMFTPADGGEPTDFVSPSDPTAIVNYQGPRSAMFLWRPVAGFEAPCADGDQDASIEWHEYTHGITNRTVGGPDDADALGAQQSGSMGEAWSDWFALHFLHQLGLEKDAVEGKYATGNNETGIRNFALDKSPLTYADFGYDRTGPEVHADGEIWADTLWELRTALVKKYGEKVGGEKAGLIVYGGLALAPRLPSFLDMRDAIMQASASGAVHGIVVRPGSASSQAALTTVNDPDRALLWNVFAHRGMGVSASSKDANDIHPHPAFDMPSGNGTLAGRVLDADGGALPGAKIALGFGEGAGNPVVLSKADESFSVPVMPGDFRLTVAAPGYGSQPQGLVHIASASTTTITVVLYKNLASIGYGATVPSGLAEGDPGAALIDDHEFTQQLMTTGTPVVIKLGGAGASMIHAVSVAPRSRSVTRAPTKFTLELSVDGKTWKKVLTGGVKTAKPRPRVEDAARVFVTLPQPMLAHFARFTPQDTVGHTTQAVVAGVQVYGLAPGLGTSPVGGDPDATGEGTVLVANSSDPTASVTLNAFQQTCDTPPAPIQGLDSYIWKLPDNAGDGVHTFVETNKGGTATDIDNYFYGADCNTPTGQIATGAASEAGTVPIGSKWVQVVLFAGTTDGFTLKVSTTLERARGPVSVQGRHVTRPTTGGGQHLPATGVGTHWLLALLALALAFGVQRYARKGI